jgi:uncharacterized protein (TIGR03000 family)
MYSVVLMAALTAGGASADWHGYRGGWNSGYGGCYGGGHYGYGGYGGGWCGGGGYGGYGGGYGGGYYGGGPYNGGWYMGGGWQGPAGFAPVNYGGYGCYGAYGGWSCYGCYGGGYANPYPQVAPVYGSGGGMPPVIKDKGPEEVPPPKKEKNPDSVSANRARVIVQLPADAKLFIDDNLMKTTSATRTFQTPALEPGHTYFYILRAEVIRDGQKKVETARVILRPGQEVRTSFNTLDAPATSTAQATKD